MAVPATVSTPVRAVAFRLNAAWNWTVPLPFPLYPGSTVSQDTLLEAVHWQPDAVCTDTDPL